LQDVDLTSSILQLQGRVGYDFGLGPFTLRPNLGFGVATTAAELDSARVTDSYFVLAPGAEFLLGLGFLSASAEARYNKVFSDEGGDADGLIFGLGLGVSF
ncbi:MAG TPA: outer membrane beta-barrel protein, partial [Polyangiaceae bacterium]|nr:outer membrane beta-barrel protein [Polyangiaceae bacterium]